MKRRVVVTGIGALTPIGNNVNDTWKGILNHQCGIDSIIWYFKYEGKSSRWIKELWSYWIFR